MGAPGGLTRCPRMGPHSGCLPGLGQGGQAQPLPHWLPLPVPWVSLFRGFKETHLLENCRKMCKHGNGP